MRMVVRSSGAVGHTAKMHLVSIQLSLEHRYEVMAAAVQFDSS